MSITGEWTFLEVYEELVAYLKEKGNQSKFYVVNKYHQFKAYVVNKSRTVVNKVKEASDYVVQKTKDAVNAGGVVLKEGYERVRNFFINKLTGAFVFKDEATEPMSEESDTAGVLLLPHLSDEEHEQGVELLSEEKIALTINDFATVVGEFKLTPNMLKTALNHDKCILHGKELSRYQAIARSKQYQDFLVAKANERGFALSKSELQELINRIVVNGRYTPEFMAMVNLYKTKGE